MVGWGLTNLGGMAAGELDARARREEKSRYEGQQKLADMLNFIKMISEGAKPVQREMPTAEQMLPKLTVGQPTPAMPQMSLGGKLPPGATELPMAIGGVKDWQMPKEKSTTTAASILSQYRPTTEKTDFLAELVLPGVFPAGTYLTPKISMADLWSDYLQTEEGKEGGEMPETEGRIAPPPKKNIVTIYNPNDPKKTTYSVTPEQARAYLKEGWKRAITK